MKSNRLKLNLSKSVGMLIGPIQKIKNYSLDVSLKNVPLRNVTKVKYLGVWINNHLKWDDHIDYIRQQVINKIHCLRRLLPLPSRVTAVLYKLYVLPIFDYCDCIWAQAPASLLNKIDCLHVKFLNFITSSNSLVLPSLPSSLIHRRRFHLAVQSFKILHGFCPSYLSNLLFL